MTREEPYQSFATSYDKYIGPVTRGIREAAMEMIGSVSGRRILEVGCGTGLNLHRLQQAGGSVHGIDLSPLMLTEARQKLGKTAVLNVGDATQLPYPAQVFDLVIAMLTLHEMNDGMRSGVMKEMIRVCRKNGRLLLVDFHPGPRSAIKGRVVRLIILFFEWSAGQEHYDNHRQFLSDGGILGLVHSFGLDVDHSMVIGGGNVGLFRLRPG